MKIKIMHIIPSLNQVGGAEKFVIDLVSHFDKEKTEVILVVQYNNPPSDAFVETIEKYNVNIVYLKKKKGFDISNIRQLRKVIRQFHPDVINTHISSFLYAVYATRFLKEKPILFHTVHNIAEKEAGKIKRILYRKFYKCYKCYPIAISDEIKKSVESFYGLMNVDCVFNGIVYEDFYCQKRNETTNNSFVHIGRFGYQKNHDLLVDAFKLLIQKIPDLKLSLIGTGENFDGIASKIKEYGLSDNMLLLGILDRKSISRILAESKYFILTSRYEGNPISLLEAMAAGCIPFVTRVGGIPDIIQENYNGYFIGNTPEEISSKILSIISDETNQMLPETIQQSIVQYDMINVCSNYYDIYCKYLERK